MIDWCQFEPNSDSVHPTNGDMQGNQPNRGKWCWTVIGKLIDPYAPVLTANDDMFPANPSSGGSGGFPSSNVCVATSGVMTATAFDRTTDETGDPVDDACPSTWLQWVVLVDAFNDWTFDVEFSSFIIADRPNAIPCWTDSNGNGIPDVQIGSPNCDYDNADSPKTAEGDLSIDIVGALSDCGVQMTADCGETLHRVEWQVYDGCGNTSSVTSYFTVQDLSLIHI